MVKKMKDMERKALIEKAIKDKNPELFPDDATSVEINSVFFEMWRKNRLKGKENKTKVTRLK